MRVILRLKAKTPLLKYPNDKAPILAELIDEFRFPTELKKMESTSKKEIKTFLPIQVGNRECWVHSSYIEKIESIPITNYSTVESQAFDPWKAGLVGE